MGQCRRIFRIAYFLSSTFVTYLLLAIATIQRTSKAQRAGFYFFTVMAIASGLASIMAIKSVLSTVNYSKTYGTQQVKLKPMGMHSGTVMFNEIITPVTFVALAFNQSVAATIAIIVLYQFCQYRIFSGDGYMPNLTFELAGLKTYQVVKSNTKGSRLEYVIAKDKWLKPSNEATVVNLTGNANATIGVAKEPQN